MSYRGVFVDKAHPSDAGCWIDGHWGHYASQRLITIASAYGFQYAPIDFDDDDSYEAVYEAVYEEADTAEAWMNENVAPEGYSFGWNNGEFFLWPNETWEESD